jgi:hypothetical protein
MQEGSVTVERRKFGASGGERAGQAAEDYSAASFLELLMT